MMHCLLYISIPEMPPLDSLTKCALVSDIAKTFDVLGWFSPMIIKMKILLQCLWEQKVDLVPSQIFDVWRSELQCLSNQHIPRCYYHNEAHIQLHGFSDASELVLSTHPGLIRSVSCLIARSI